MRKGKFGWANAKPGGKRGKAFTQSRKGNAENLGQAGTKLHHKGTKNTKATPNASGFFFVNFVPLWCPKPFTFCTHFTDSRRVSGPKACR
jgi:hypothetical protein